MKLANFKIILDMLRELNYVMDKKQKRGCVKAFIAMLIAAVFETLGISVVIPFILAMIQPELLLENKYVKTIVDFLHIESKNGVILLMASGVILVYLVKNITILLSNHVQIKFRNNLEKDMTVLMLNSYMKRPYTFFLENNSGVILRGVNSDVGGLAQVMDGFFNFFSEFLAFLLICIFLVVLNPLIAMGLVLAVGLCALIIVLCFKSKINRLGHLSRKVFAKRFEYANQAIGGIKEITVMQRREKFAKQYEEVSTTASLCNTDYQFTGRLPAKIIEVAFIASIVLMCTLGIRGNVDVTSLIPTLSAIAVGCVRILPAASAMTAAINTLVYYRPSLHSVAEIVMEADNYEKYLEEYKKSQPSNEEYDNKNSFDESISVENIVYAYPNTEKKVLNGLSLTINKGDSVALIGESGAGKTTLADVILGLLKPEEGTIKVDGLDIFAMPKMWARLIGYVPQAVFLADDTIRNNVAFGLPENEIDDELIWRAIDQAQLRTFVEGLPEGLNTIVGERGIKFSGGQRQRVAIARALYYNPDILVLDEATSALDNETESAVMEAIDALKGQKTLIIVAHRLSTIRNCNKVYEIKAGKASLTKVEQ